MKEFKSILTNYKTSVPALAISVTAVLYLTGKITKEQADYVLYIALPALGFAAKDHTK